MYKRIDVDGQNYYGKHMLIHLQECNDNILDIQYIKKFITRLVEDIGMKAFGECHCHRFGEEEEIGISAVQLIYTSSITLHTNDLHREAYLDVFSCKDYLEKDIVEYLNENFTPENIDYQVIMRK